MSVRGRSPAFLVGLALVLVLTVLGTDAMVLAGRLGELDVELAADDTDGRTWVIVGLDSRDNLPAGADRDTFGSPEAVPGSRADVVLVLHQTDAGTTALSVPRDLLVRSGGHTSRLALTWLDGPQATVEALCALGIPTDHLAAVDLAGFVAVVDAVGGLEIDVREPTRDPGAGLLLPQAGRQTVDGATALAVVRSRHPEHPLDGVWVPAPVDPDGRADTAATVLAALVDELQYARMRPDRLHAVAWAAADALAVDPGTSTSDLLALAGSEPGAVAVLPAGPPRGSVLARRPTDATLAAVGDAGLSCAG